jgi:hypothetical protein
MPGTFLVREVLRLGCTVTEHIALASICRIASNPPLCTMQQVRKDLAVVRVHSRGHHVDELGLAIRADMRLHAEIPLVAFLVRGISGSCYFSGP